MIPKVSKLSARNIACSVWFFVVVLLASNGFKAGAQTWVSGDVFAGVGNGQYNVYSNSGVFKQTITDAYANSYTTGCEFNADFSKLYTTNFENDGVTVFDGTGNVHPVLKSVDTSSAGLDSESVVFDTSGNYYVGHADGAHGISKFSTADASLAVYYPATENRGTDWTDVGKESNILFYTSEGAHLKEFNTATESQLPDFSVALPSYASYAHKLLPPFDGTGGAIVADTSQLIRLDKNGNIAQTYNVSGAQAWFSMDIDPNGTSFWAGDLGTNLLYRFNIASGAVELGPINTLATNGDQLAGVCVKGEMSIITPPDTPPVIDVDMIVSGPPKKVVLDSYDLTSGLKSIQVLTCTNCTATTAPFTVGTTAKVLTTAVKTNQSESSVIKIEATDVDGKSTTFDPVDFTIYDGGLQKADSIEVSPSEHLVLITNGNPGVRQLDIEVNGRSIPAILELANGQHRTVDIARYMNPMIQNRVTVTAKGPLGASAWVVITEK